MKSTHIATAFFLRSGKNPGQDRPFPLSGKSGNNAWIVITPGDREFHIVREFDEETQANMDTVLADICSELPHGGNHEIRKFIAEQLIEAAREGKTGFEELSWVGRRAFVHLQNRSKPA